MRNIFLCTIFLLLTGMPAHANAADFKVGEHYTIVAPEPTSEPLVQEFFSYGCGGCSSFDSVFQQAKRALSDQADFKYVPVDFGGGFWTPTQDLFLVLEALGRREEMHQAAFGHFFGQPQQPKTEASVKAFLAQHGISEEQYEKTVSSFAVHVKESRYDKLTKQYRISSTPTVIVNGKYRAEHGAVGNAQEFVQLIRYLLQNP